jgi:capsular polysaccharide biosynthesis protein
LWRHKIFVAASAVLGLAAGLGYAALTAPMLTSTATVYLPSSVHYISTQVIIAKSDPVLLGALRTLDSSESPQTLRSAIQVKNVSANVITFSATGKTAAQAERTANAVANSYTAYINAPSRPGPSVQAMIVTSATAEGASGPSKISHSVSYGVLGALAGLLIGSIVVLAASPRPGN